ncbi:MAG: hypothetical protein JSR79_09760, partial [Proteobacteria bacterium]|nr:hypothetical protein [Pseudomonadota bacterium]
MSGASDQFDNRLLYRVGFDAPVWVGPMLVRRTIGWESTRPGAFIAAEMYARVLTEHEIAVSHTADLLFVNWPPSVGPLPMATIRIGEMPTNPDHIRKCLDLCTAAMAREAMMKRMDWWEGDIPPAWSLATTEITEEIMRLDGTDSHHVWTMAGHDDRFAVTLRKVTTGEVNITRQGNLLLTTYADLAPGVVLQQVQETFFLFDEPQPLDDIAALRPGSRLGDAIGVIDAPVGYLLAQLVVRDVVDRRPDGHVWVAVSMPLITMAPIPEDALAMLAPASLPRDARVPIWLAVKRLERAGTVLPITAPPGDPAAKVPNDFPSAMRQQIPAIADAAWRTIRRAPVEHHHRIALKIIEYIRRRVSFGDDPSEIITEEEVLANSMATRFLNDIDPARRGGKFCVNPLLDPNCDPAIAAEVAWSIRVIRSLYAQFHEDGVREHSPLDMPDPCVT